MKIQIISDLHQEFGISDLNFENADLIILSGDTNLGTKGIEWVKKYVPNKPVIYILRNHEYYKGIIRSYLLKYKPIKGTIPLVRNLATVALN